MAKRINQAQLKAALPSIEVILDGVRTRIYQDWLSGGINLEASRAQLESLEGVAQLIANHCAKDPA